MTEFEKTAEPLPAEFAQAVDRAYAVFAQYQSVPPLLVHCCPHCFKADEQELLFSRPLRELAWTELEEYSFNAVHSYGTVEDFKHFLPRILELLAVDATCRFDPPAISRKLRLAHWRTWPTAESDAISNFFDAWWQWRLATDPDNWFEIRTLVMILGTVFDDLMPFLAYWDSRVPQTLAAARQLASFVKNNTWSGDPYHVGCVWGADETHARTIANWLFDPKKAEFLAAAYDDESRSAFGILNLDRLAAYHTMCVDFVAQSNRS